MKFGAMNNPLKPVLKEIEFFGKSGFDFIELAVDAPLTIEKLLKDKKKILKTLSSYKLGIIEHAPCFVSTADLYEGIRKASQKEVLDSLDLANELRVKKVVIHPSYVKGLGRFRKEEIKKMGYEFLAKLYDKANELEIILCLENMRPKEGWLFEPEEFKPIFRDFKKMKLILDTGHANVTGKNICLKFIKMFRKRIGHFHVSDNFGFEDDHIPLGCGIIDFDKIFSALKKTGYNDTMTLEVFPNDRDYLFLSLKKAKELWKKI
jgi:sugar phosphate isomerase/epimerase